MEGLEGLAKMFGMGEDSSTGQRILFGEELDDFRKSFVRIEGLKPGDKVRWKRGYADARMPSSDEVVEVCRVFDPMQSGHNAGTNHFTDSPDFSFAFMSKGVYYESAADSRRFERV